MRPLPPTSSPGRPSARPTARLLPPNCAHLHHAHAHPTRARTPLNPHPPAQVPLDSPDRFVVEMLFSNGANYDPTRVVPLANDHTLPIVPRVPLHTGEGTPLQRLFELLEPCAAPRKAAPGTYALQASGRAPLSPALLRSAVLCCSLPCPALPRSAPSPGR